jgi:hypothetical protein
MPRRWLALVLALIALLAGCASQATVTPPTSAPRATPRAARVPPTPPTTRAATAGARATTAVTATAHAGALPLPTTPDAPLDPRTVIRTFADARGRAITLYYGRGAGRGGDWGWAHILGKHLYGEWRDGGPVTTFSVVGITTPEGVLAAIGSSLRDPRPTDGNGGRREYRVLATTGRHELLTVVGSDGAIITAYPDPIAGGR